MARDRREAHELPDVDPANLTLREYMVAYGQSDPSHFAPVVDAITDAVNGKKTRCVVEGPRQHGKTTLVEHGASWALHKRPELDLCYATYGQDYSGKRSRQIRHLYQASGGRLSPDHNTIQEWRNNRDGGLLATSPGGSLVGHTVQLGFLDDLHKGRAEAEVAANRDLVDEWIKSDLLGCITPSGSVFLVASRYHEDDASGRRIVAGWDRIRLPAICDDEANDPLKRLLGEPLCPWGPDPLEPRTLQFLLEKQEEVGSYDWDSLYMCRPRSRGGALFRNVAPYLRTGIPKIVRTIRGLDLAYSNVGDWIVVVTLGLGVDGILYVLDVYRERKSVVEVQRQVYEACMRCHHHKDCRDHPDVGLGCGIEAGQDQIAMYYSGPEKGILGFMMQVEDPLYITGIPARYGKGFRSEKTAQRWNRGAIKVDVEAKWADPFTREVCAFDGLDGHRDDQVDALVGAHDLLMVLAQSHGKTLLGQTDRHR